MEAFLRDLSARHQDENFFMNTFRLLMIGSLFFGFLGSALGAGSSSGTILDYALTNGNIFTFKISGTKITPPVCDTNKRYALLVNNDSGKAMKDAIIAAKNSGLSVDVVGTGACASAAGSEDTSYFYVKGASVSGKTTASCVSGASVTNSNFVDGNCSCAVRTISKQTTYSSCTAASESGNCSAQGSGYPNPSLGYPNGAYGSCCVCGTN